MSEISQKNHTAIASLVCHQSVQEIIYLLSNKRIPVIQLPCLNGGAAVNGRGAGCRKNAHINGDLLVNAAVSIVTSLRWDELVLFYDDSAGMRD